MNDQAKSREELLNELQELRVVYVALKACYEKDTTDQQNTIADLVKAKEKQSKAIGTNLIS